MKAYKGMSLGRTKVIQAKREAENVKQLIESVKTEDIELYNRKKYDLEKVQKDAQNRILDAQTYHIQTGKGKRDITIGEVRKQDDSFINGGIKFY